MVSDDILSWYTKERAEMQPLPHGGLMIGGIVYSPRYLALMTDWCVPTLLAPANREALRGSTIALYTDEETRATMDGLLATLTDAGFNVVIRVMPADIMSLSSFWERLGTAQALLVTLAARSGMAFHQLHPDQLYSKNYFPNLLKLSTRHRRIAHTGLNVKDAAVPELERYRRADRSLELPVKPLTDIAWKHVHWRIADYTMKNADAEQLPRAHFQLWRARDRVMIFSPHMNTTYMDAETCSKLDVANPPTTTLDALVQHLYGLDYYVPKFNDGMSYIGLEWRGPEEPPNNVVGREAFGVHCRAHVGNRVDYLVCFNRPTEMEASIDEVAPTFGDVLRQQAILVKLMKTAK